MRLTDQGKYEGKFNLIFIGFLILNTTFITMIVFDGILITYLYSSLNCPYRFFCHSGIQDVDRSIGDDVETIKGNRKFHSIKTKLSKNVFSLDKRKYFCFCHVCIDNTKSNDVCENKMYVED